MCFNDPTAVPTETQLTLPGWLPELLEAYKFSNTNESRMELAVQLARWNIDRNRGGPFGAAVFEMDTGQLISVGMNRVTALGHSIAHAEIMALTLAQKKLGRARINEDGQRYSLYTSAQPCAMCFGAIPWAGIDEVVIGARREDVESITVFEEGPVHPDWINELQKRQISVLTDVCREQACAVLRHYAEVVGTGY